MSPTEEAVAEDSALATAEEAKALLQEARRERRIAECERSLEGMLTATRLPGPFQDKLRRRFAASESSSEVIQEAIDEETAALASVLDAQLITGMGAEKATITSRTELDRFQTALDLLLGVEVAEADRVGLPKLGGIREAYIVATGDPDVSGATDSERALVREADTTVASFTFLLGTSMNKRLLKEYQAWPNEWAKFALVVPIKDFKQQDRIKGLIKRESACYLASFVTALSPDKLVLLARVAVLRLKRVINPAASMISLVALRRSTTIDSSSNHD